MWALGGCSCRACSPWLLASLRARARREHKGTGSPQGSYQGGVAKDDSLHHFFDEVCRLIDELLRHDRGLLGLRHRGFATVSYNPVANKANPFFNLLYEAELHCSVEA